MFLIELNFLIFIFIVSLQHGMGNWINICCIVYVNPEIFYGDLILSGSVYNQFSKKFRSGYDLWKHNKKYV